LPSPGTQQQYLALQFREEDKKEDGEEESGEEDED
jgi:hypothetical protein